MSLYSFSETKRVKPEVAERLEQGRKIFAFHCIFVLQFDENKRTWGNFAGIDKFVTKKEGCILSKNLGKRK